MAARAKKGATAAKCRKSGGATSNLEDAAQRLEDALGRLERAVDAQGVQSEEAARSGQESDVDAMLQDAAQDLTHELTAEGAPAPVVENDRDVAAPEHALDPESLPVEQKST